MSEPLNTTTLATLLTQVASLLATELREIDTPGTESIPRNTPPRDVTHSLATAHTMQLLSTEALGTLVHAARERGTTWQSIGNALGISRQAAFQRFGNPIDPRTGNPMNKPTPTQQQEAVTHAVTFLDVLTAHDWEGAAHLLGPKLGDELDAKSLADAWAQVVALGGELEARHPAQTVSLADEVLVVEQLLDFEAADLVGRISYNREGEMVGLWFLPADQALSKDQSR